MLRALEQKKKETNMSSQYGGYNPPSAGGSGFGASDTSSLYAREPGSRRKKLAALAGTVYRAGAAAASELKNQYDNTRIRGVEDIDESHSRVTIPGSFPDVAIVVKGNEQMVLFPSYAKSHVRQFDEFGEEIGAESRRASGVSMNDEDYWRNEWARLEDKKAIVDVDVRGWVYSPHKGPMTRKNRVMIGLARRLSGIPAPTAQGSGQNLATPNEEREDLREQQKIAKEAEQIQRKGKAEEEAAVRGGYTETPKEEDSDGEGRVSPMSSRSGNHTPLTTPSSPTLGARPMPSGAVAELTDAELGAANANLMARLGPFLTTPLVQLPVTLFFYNDKQSQSRTVTTNDAGHFSIRAALDFVPTHVRVLANENLSVVEPVQVTEDHGISLISDIDDTVKKSSISLGAREIFRNTFIRDLKDLAVEGVQEWYNTLFNMGVRVHYCSNSPWQLFPVIATFFHMSGLPPGSLHLKQYSGMLQGIFEPVAERKRGTLDRILRDFPERKFLLVGDSGEADLEVYTDLAVANPGRILAVFIRDVTTPEQSGYFDAAFSGRTGQQVTRPGKIPASKLEARNTVDVKDPIKRPTIPPRTNSEPPKAEGPAMGTLIDFSDEPQEMTPNESQNLEQLVGDHKDMADGGERRKPPPPRPNKPSKLKGRPSQLDLSSRSATGSPSSEAPPPLPSRKTSGPKDSGAYPHPLTQMQNLSDQTLGSNTSLNNINSRKPNASSSYSSSKASSTSSSDPKGVKPPPPPPPPRRRATQAVMHLSPRLRAQRRVSSNADIEGIEPLPSSTASTASSPPRTAMSSGQQTPNGTGGGGGGGGGNPQLGPVNKKLELWRRRVERAHDTLDKEGVKLYTWRRGGDVVLEAVGIVKEALAKHPDRKLERLQEQAR